MQMNSKPQSQDIQQDKISCGAKVEYMNAVIALISESGNMSYKCCLQWHVCKVICPPSFKKNTHNCLANDPKLILGKIGPPSSKKNTHNCLASDPKLILSVDLA